MNYGRMLVAVLTATSLLAPTAHAAQDGPALPGAAEGTVIVATVSAYASGGGGGSIGSMTASGVQTHWGTVAADWSLYPVGTRLQIEGFPNDIFTVEDSGGEVHGNVFDVWFPDLAAATAFGTKTLRVTILST